MLPWLTPARGPEATRAPRTGAQSPRHTAPDARLQLERERADEKGKRAHVASLKQPALLYFILGRE